MRRRVTDDYFEGHEGSATVDATIVIRLGDVEEIEAARGVGVVNALDLALRKALLKYFPYLSEVRVTETYMHASGESTEAEGDVSRVGSRMDISRGPRCHDRRIR